MKVSVSILSADFSNLKSFIDKIPNADYLHMDVMDGHFVPNISFGFPVIKALKKIWDKQIDTHLMISNPSQYIRQFAEYSDIITVSYECIKFKENISKLIDTIHKEGCNAGIAISPGTPVEKIEKYLKKVELVLVMTVEPGFGGQKFREDCIPKFKQLRKLQKKKGMNFEIEVDGGIDLRTIKKCDVDIAVVGSYVVKSSNPADAIDGLKHQSRLKEFEK
ncbi:ribulose-phosphate 3-epimerase [Candidatus Woesearchaeota archaeon]|nr:ribulose-phosphate 3-epimerase [Candidatus Woesearchaeota archaeon]MBW3018150.1 ribulose-phosphate 3-epimerase [Candidatus Woesearchaeota archaeon]